MLSIFKRFFVNQEQHSVDLNSACIIDVRSPREFNYGHVQGAVNIPLEQLHNHFDALKLHDTIVVYCRSGNRSTHAKRILNDHGFDNVTDTGSLEATAQVLSRKIVIESQLESIHHPIKSTESTKTVNILIPADFTPQTDFATIMGEKLGEYLPVILHFVHVIDLPETVTLDDKGNVATCGEIDPEYVEKLKKDAEFKLSEVQRKAKVETTTKLHFGKLTDTILSVAESQQVDVILVGTKGLWGLKEKVTTTQAQILARKSNIPVLSLMCDRSDLELQSILFVHDFLENDVKHPDFMNTLIKACNAKVYQLYITKTLSDQFNETLIATMDNYAKEHNIHNYENHIVKGDDIESGVTAFLADQDADIVFIGTHGDGGVFHASGAEALIKHLFKPKVTFHLA